MEFVLGALIATASIIAFNKAVVKLNKQKTFKIKHSQSYIYDHIGPAMRILDSFSFPDYKDTQSRKFIEDRHMTIAIAEDTAYWIENNTLYSVDISSGNFEKENGKRVDTMAMDKLELNKITFIVEQLTEADKNDRGSSGNKKF